MPQARLPPYHHRPIRLLHRTPEHRLGGTPAGQEQAPARLPATAGFFMPAIWQQVAGKEH